MIEPLTQNEIEGADDVAAATRQRRWGFFDKGVLQ